LTVPFTKTQANSTSGGSSKVLQSGARGGNNARVDDEAMAMFHEDFAEISEPRFTRMVGW